MKGQVQVVVFNGAVRYEFLLRRNLTIIRGDSATGKTTLVELIREYYEAGEQSPCVRCCSQQHNWHRGFSFLNFRRSQKVE